MTTAEFEKAKEIRKHVNAMIKETFDILAETYKNRQEGKFSSQNVDCKEKCRLIFPSKREDELRISEQELRFVFTEVFNRYCNDQGNKYNKTHEELTWFYSIETPTMQKYRFSENKKNIYPQKTETGQSANFDFVIHDQELKRICLIEFKALNSDWHEHHKDFYKLINDIDAEKYHNYTQCYFIEVLASSDNETYKNLARKKIKLEENKTLTNTEREIGEKIAANIIEFEDDKHYSSSKILFGCYSLNDRKNDKEGIARNITSDIIKQLK